MSKSAQQKWLPIVIGFVIGALLPMVSVGLVTLLDEKVSGLVLAPFTILWSLVSLPGVIFPSSRAGVIIEGFWMALVAVVGILVASRRHRRQKHAVPNA